MNTGLNNPNIVGAVILNNWAYSTNRKYLASKVKIMLTLYIFDEDRTVTTIQEVPMTDVSAGDLGKGKAVLLNKRTLAYIGPWDDWETREGLRSFSEQLPSYESSENDLKLKHNGELLGRIQIVEGIIVKMYYKSVEYIPAMMAWAKGRGVNTLRVDTRNRSLIKELKTFGFKLGTSDGEYTYLSYS